MPSHHDQEDMDQEAALAACMARASAACRSRERKHSRREVAGSTLAGPDARQADLSWFPDSRKVVGLGVLSQTNSGRRRAIRDQMIYAASLAGMSQRAIAEAVGLTHARVFDVVARMRTKVGIDPYANPATSDTVPDWLPKARIFIASVRPPQTTPPRERRRACRNRMIHVAAISGMSQSYIAVALDIGRSGVCWIIDEMRTKVGIDPYA